MNDSICILMNLSLLGNALCFCLLVIDGYQLMHMWYKSVPVFRHIIDTFSSLHRFKKEQIFGFTLTKPPQMILVVRRMVNEGK